MKLKQITDVDYGTFMTMINDKNIGKLKLMIPKFYSQIKNFVNIIPYFYILQFLYK